MEAESLSHDPSRAVGDPDRLAALRRTALLDTPHEETFDRLTRLAARLLLAPVALLSLVDADRQVFTGCTGLPEPWATERQTPLSHSFCQYVVAAGAPLRIEDARAHPLVQGSPAVSQLGVVAYAGVPLLTTDGHALGSLCAIDTRPRAWSAEEIGVLQALATLVMAVIERRAMAVESEAARRRLSAFLDTAPVGVLTCGPDGTPDYANREAERILGRPLRGGEMEGVRLLDTGGEPIPPERTGLARVLRGEEGPLREDLIVERPDGERVWIQADASRVCEENGNLLGGMVVFVNITKRVQAERRGKVLYAVSRVLMEAADLEGAAASILQTIAEGFAWEMGALWELDAPENVLLCRRTWHKPGGVLTDFAAASHALRFGRGLGLPGQVWANGTPVWIPDFLSDERFSRRLAARVGLHAAFAFPIQGQSGTLGVIEFFSREIRRPDPELLRMAATLGNQVGQFVERKRAEAALAAAHERARRVAESLENSLLLRVPEDEFSALSLATIYEAAWSESLVGGDFFDAFSLGGGRVALVVGDATGKGLSAGIRTAEIKFVLRAFLRELPDPGHAFARLNDFLHDAQRVSYHDPESFIVLTLVVIDTTTGVTTFTVAGAEEPIILRAGGTGETVPATGLPLGILPGQVYAAAMGSLAPGDAVLLTTDGITEARRGPREFLGNEGMLRLAEQAAAGSVRYIGQAVLEGARAFAGGTLHDDVCILVARRR